MLGGAGVRARPTLHLARPLADWVAAMAVAHNCGSDNKTMRDLLDFYGDVRREELRVVLVEEVHGGADEPCDGVLAAHLTRGHVDWLLGVSAEFALTPDAVLQRLVAFAMDELDDDALFETAPHLAKCTADLYSDCNIFRNVC